MSKLYSLVSDSINPFENLAIEDQILKSIRPNEKVLLFYRNKPCVVIGRFQNPWREINMNELNQLPLVRRQSGGGTVYHDEGNLCYSFIYGERDHHKDDNNKILIEALKKFNIQARPSQRSDLVVGERKFSGSAFKQKKDSSFHHGTLLVNANLKSLGGILKSPYKELKGKGILSNPSPVVNLKELNPKLTMDALIKGITEEFSKYYQGNVDTYDFDFSNQEYQEFLESWKWRTGETPEFKFEKLGYQWTIDKGVIVDVHPIKPEVENLDQLFKGSELKVSKLEEIKGSHTQGNFIQRELGYFFNELHK